MPFYRVVMRGSGCATDAAKPVRLRAVRIVQAPGLRVAEEKALRRLCRQLHGKLADQAGYPAQVGILTTHIASWRDKLRGWREQRQVEWRPLDGPLT